METPHDAERPAPPGPQTIILERRSRLGWIGRIVWFGLILILFATFFGGVVGRDSGLPVRLSEHYVAGELSGAKVAVVEVSGLIMDDVVEHALRQLRQARDDSQVRAVVLRIDSPGGTVSGADQIWREVEVLKARNKPVIASMAGIAASGGYYIAAPADAILAEPTTMTGSIGVLLELPELSGLLKKLGVEFQTLTTGEWKDSGSLFRPLTDRERDRWKSVIDDAYQRFVRVVAQGRKLPRADVLALADGKVYTADEAEALKLIDRVGYLDDAILEAQRLARIESSKVIRYARDFGLMEALLGASAAAPKSSLTIDPQAPLKLQTPRLLLLAR